MEATLKTALPDDRRTDAIVLFAHGARDSRWAESLERLAVRLRQTDPRLPVSVAFLDFQQPTLAQALDALASQGVRNFSVVPVFWSLGGHVVRDLPAMLDEAKQRLGNVEIHVLPVLSELPDLEDRLTSSVLHLHRRRISRHGGNSSGDTIDAGPFLKEIGRGRRGARGLARADARRLMDAILDGRISDIALGGILLALRMKGEQAEEVAGFLDSVEERLALAPARSPGWVILPSYNGARSQPNLVPLLALLLSRSGIPVLIHGMQTESRAAARPRVTTQAILKLLDIEPCPHPALAGTFADRHVPAFIDLTAISPEFAALLALRHRLGLRNIGHTLAKLIAPVEGRSLLIASYTHPEFGAMQDALFAMGDRLAMSMRGTEGEPVVSVRRTQSIDLWCGGQRRCVIAERELESGDEEVPERDAAATAAWTDAVLQGRRPVPAGVAAQVRAILDAIAE